MKTASIVIAISVLGAVGTGAYWLGARNQVSARNQVTATAQVANAPPPRKLMYYRNPMGLADTSPTPKKDPMGMEYTAVYDDEQAPVGASGANQIQISTEKVQRLGVRTEPAAMRLLGKTVRAAGKVEPDERRIYAISPKFEGYVERLHVNVTGQPVAKGQPLFEAYSPELLSAQREYGIAVQGMQAMKDAGAEAQAGMNQLAESSLARLRNWGLSAEQVTALMRTGQSHRTISYPSPVSGVVTEKKALQGMRFMPGDMLYQVTDLSSVWVIADVFEQDIGSIRLGAKAAVTTTAYPNKVFDGRVTYIYPTLKTETRTAAVRVELANPGLLLKPAMFAQVEFAMDAKVPVLTVPDSAVIDSGTRRIVLVQLAQGRFEPREVEVGGRGLNFVEVTKGVLEGEQVVVAANFLIDAESNLKAVVGGFGAHAGHGSAVKKEAGVAAAPGASPRNPAAAGHNAQGVVEGIDRKAVTVTLNHGPVATLKWPAMTMEFKAANSGLLDGLKTGQQVAFEFVERQPGEFVVTSISASPGGGVAATAAEKPALPTAGTGSHTGH